jgi:hypothetical protein
MEMNERMEIRNEGPELAGEMNDCGDPIDRRNEAKDKKRMHYTLHHDIVHEDVIQTTIR